MTLEKVGFRILQIGVASGAGTRRKTSGQTPATRWECGFLEVYCGAGPEPW